MKYDKLVSKLYILDKDTTELEHGAKAVQALRTIVELHKPFRFESNPDEYKFACEECQIPAIGDVYPCITIKAIENQLK